MRRLAATLGLATMAAAVASPVAAQNRKDEIRDLVFDLCPKVLAGTVSLADSAHLQPLGFSALTPKETPGGSSPRAERGTGTGKVMISSGGNTCSVRFGGPDNPQLAGSVLENGRKAQFEGSGRPQRLGDGTLLFLVRSKADANRSVIIIMADAGGELGVTPATTVVMMDEKGK